ISKSPATEALFGVSATPTAAISKRIKPLVQKMLVRHMDHLDCHSGISIRRDGYGGGFGSVFGYELGIAIIDSVEGIECEHIVGARRQPTEACVRIIARGCNWVRYRSTAGESDNGCQVSGRKRLQSNVEHAGIVAHHDLDRRDIAIFGNRQ